MYHLEISSQGMHGYISLRRNLKSLTGLKNLRLWWKPDREEDKGAEDR